MPGAWWRPSPLADFNMAKRYTDNTKWSDDWFCELLPNMKLAYIYLLDQCDTVGVWKPNFRLSEFQLGIKIDWEKFKEICGEKRIYIMPNGYWWIIKFCDYQYKIISETSTSPATKSYIELLKKHGLWNKYLNINNNLREDSSDHSETLPPQLKREQLKPYTEEKPDGTHSDFVARIMHADFSLDRESIEVSCKKKLTTQILKEFNANCVNQSKVHQTFVEWKKHLANWYSKRKEDIKTPTKYKELE